MNLKHLSAFVWLRSRIRVNQFRKGGTAGQIILVILSVMMVMAGVGLFVGGFFAGLFGLPAAPSAARLLIWDGVVVAFVFVWMLGLLTALRAEERVGNGATSFSEVLGRINRMGRHGNLVVVVSDFRGDSNWRLPLLELTARHTVIAVEIRVGHRGRGCASGVVGLGLEASASIAGQD